MGGAVFSFCFHCCCFFKGEDNSISTMLKQEVASKAAIPGGGESLSPVGFTRVRLDN